MRIQRTTRGAFTIVEMMVSMALILFIMAVIAQVFSSASKTYTALRVAGQLQERARTGSQVLRRDLTTEHFGGPFIPGRSGPRVGDQRLDLAGWMPPTTGYFEIRQFNAVNPVIFEPLAAPSQDGEQLASTRATDHVLRFTSKLPDLPASELYCAGAPNTPINAAGQVIATDRNVTAFPSGQAIVYSRWAEIQYFLSPNGENTPQTASGPSLPLFSLRRRIRVLAPAGVTYDNVPSGVASSTIAQFPELAMLDIGPGSTVPNSRMLRVLGPDDLTNPALRMPYQTPVTKAGVITGDDILITDVISFEVKAAWLRNFNFNNQDVPNPNGPIGLFGSSPDSAPLVNINNGTTNNSDAPFDNIPRSILNTGGLAGQRVFDTWFRSSSADGLDWNNPSMQNNGFLSPATVQPPLRINVRALQIKIRVWDPKAEQARQITVAQEI